MKSQIPQTDSIRELAHFWDTHDLTDFEDQLEEVVGPAFQRRTMVKIPLSPEEAKAIRQMAKSKGVESSELIRQWVLEKVETP